MSYQIVIIGSSLEELASNAATLAAKLGGTAAPAAAKAAPAEAKAEAKPAATPAKAEAKPAAAAKPAAKPATPPPAEEPSAGAVTLKELRDKGMALIKAGKAADLKKLLAEYGAEGLSAIPEDKFDEVNTKLDELSLS